MRKFEFKKAYEEIDISGKSYKIDFSDDKLNEYNRNFVKFHKEANKLAEKDIMEMNEKEKKDMQKKQAELLESVVDGLLGYGSYEELYEASGKSVMNMVDLIEYLGDIMKERMESNKKDKRNYYTK